MNIKEYVRVCLEEYFYESKMQYIDFSKKYKVSTSQIHNIIRSNADKLTIDKMIEISERCGLIYQIKCHKKEDIERRNIEEEYEE